MPRLLIVRHAIAQERAEANARNLPDAERPLTDKGRRRMRQAAAGIRLQAGPLGSILSSPLRRARQTADILAGEYPGAARAATDALSPGRPLTSLIAELAEAPEETLAIVGHEPDLSTLIALLLCGNDRGSVQLKKGGAALLDFPSRIAAGQGTLLWLLRPGQLRALGRST